MVEVSIKAPMLFGRTQTPYSRSPKVGSPIASILKSNPSTIWPSSGFQLYGVHSTPNSYKVVLRGFRVPLGILYLEGRGT